MKVDYRYHYTDKELHEDWSKLIMTKHYKTGSQFKPGMKLCQHFCDNFWEIQNNKGLTFADCWNNPILMDKVRIWGLEGMSELWLSWVRRAVFMSSGLPNSSFYRPHLSRQVIHSTGIRNGLLFDPCAGWGGRMLGTVSYGWNYVSCEPNIKTYDNLRRIIDFLEIHDKVKLYNIPVEDFDIQSIKPDVVLTSPPYFNLEVYNNESNQSYNKYDQYESWRDNWLYSIIEGSLGVINQQGISAWNVMNFKRYDLVGDIISIHEKHGWELYDTVGFKSPLANIRKLKNKDVTYLFKKTS